MFLKMDDYEESDFLNADPDDIEEEENGHDYDDEDLERAIEEREQYGSDEENENLKPTDEGEEDDLIDFDREGDDNVDDFAEKEKEEKEKKKKSKIVPSSKRKTNPVMTKFEYAYMVSQRAVMIENNSPLMNPKTNLVSAIDIAKEETELKLNPIIIQRKLPNGSIEEWKCSELSLPRTYVE
jgi:DNA-directed RNA polymerase subunit K/omega